MAHWVSATRHDGVEVMINLDAAYEVAPRQVGGSVVSFIAGDGPTGRQVAYNESPAQLLAKGPSGR